MKKNTFLRVGLVLTALMAAFILLGLFWTPYAPNAMDFSRLLPPSSVHPMGTDKFGRDILSRVMVGAGDTLLIALGTVVIGTAVVAVWAMTIPPSSAPYFQPRSTPPIATTICSVVISIRP